jgi:glutamyl-Q tRNA(Asp) synthetase
MTPTAYIGRFAPSPTGPLHLGSLYTAVASYVDAKSQQGQWLLRIEDIDPPREQAGASTAIIKSLQAHGLHWDGEIIYQSLQNRAYEQQLQALLEDQQCFYCSCSRQQLQACNGAYSGECRGQLQARANCAIRFRVDTPVEQFFDHNLGLQQLAAIPEACVHDFVIKRRDGLFAYQLAVTVDDIASGVNNIVRGSDILDSSFKQLSLYQGLKTAPAQYFHLPVLSRHQQKLSKQNKAPAINNQQPCDNLQRVLQLLGQPTKQELNSPSEILTFAVEHWDRRAIKKTLAISI